MSAGGGAVDFRLPIVPRYAEIDLQGVVFNAHYLTWFDEAMTAYLAHLDLPYEQLIADGCDVMLVHTEIDYAASVRRGDEVAVAVTCERLGSTSFTLRFGVLRRGPGDVEESEAVVGHTVYVCVVPVEYTKRPVPDTLVAVLGGR